MASSMVIDSVHSNERNCNSHEGIVALLHLPIETKVSIDGHPLMIKRDDFVGFNHIPSEDAPFHFVTVQATSILTSDNGPPKRQSSWITVGFVVFPSTNSDWIFARSYDPQTEEVSSTPLDEMSESNLLQTIQSGRMESQRVISYDRILPPGETCTWRKQGSFITAHLLKLRGLESGDKVVPGSYATDNETQAEKEKSLPQIVDGVSISYPPIPVLDTSLASTNHRTTGHEGTKKYLAQLSPLDRTALFVEHNNPAFYAITDILTRYYDNNWRDLLGDIQFSYLLFLHLHCLSSLEHWRDLVSMLSLIPEKNAEQFSALYAGLLQVLFHHVASMEQDFYEDMEYSGGNFFVPAVRRLCVTCSKLKDDEVQAALASLQQVISTRFSAIFEDDTGQGLETPCGESAQWSSCEATDKKTSPGIYTKRDEHISMDYDDDDDDDDGPVIVPSEEVEASLERSIVHTVSKSRLGDYSEQHRAAYPLIFGSMVPNEDILMACARVLDDASDVSLVREAASYLQDVESKKL